MGAWGSGPFENDGALDFAADFLEARDRRAWLLFRSKDKRSMLRHALRTLETTRHFDMGSVEEGVAAAEVIAAGLGRPSPSCPEDLARWARTPSVKVADLAARAAAAVARAGDAPAFKELWFDPADFEQWRVHAADLRRRLA